MNMRYIIEIYEKNEIAVARAHGAEGIMLPLQFYSAHTSSAFELDELAELVSLAEGMEVYIDATRMFTDNEMDQVAILIEKCKELAIKGIYFADISGYQMCHEAQAEYLCYYQPDTMIVNSRDAAFWLELMGGICLAKELTIEEICRVAENVQGNVEVFLHGTPLMSMSKRPLIENYFDEINYKGELKDIYYLQEEKRQEPFPVLRNDQGTFFFAAYVQESFKELEALNKAHTKQGRISHFNVSFDEMMDALDVYKDIEVNGYDEAKVEAFKAKYPMNNYTTGFYHMSTTIKRED